MPTYHVVARSVQPPGPPIKRRSRALRRLLPVLGYVQGINILAGLFVLTLLLAHSELAFVLLPVGASIAVTAMTSRYSLTSLRTLLIIILVALVFFGGITGFELLTHAGISSKIILVTTTLAIVVILDPVRMLLQNFLFRHLPGRADATSLAVASFTTSLREEIDLDHVRDQFLDTVQRLLHPQSVALWVRKPLLEVPSTEHDAPPATATDAIDQAAPPAERGWDWTRLPATSMDIAIDDHDPFVAYAVQHPDAVELEHVQVDSPVLRMLRQQAIELMLPLVSQGELLGVLLLGPRLRLASRPRWTRGARGRVIVLVVAVLLLVTLPFTFLLLMTRQLYTGGDLEVLDTLGAQVAAALRVVDLVRARQAQVRSHERIEQELRTAQQIQRTFLPKTLPDLPGWRLAPYYQPAREVGGDFYDVLPLADGRVGLIIGDVTGKGIPAALMMTATRTMLRTAAQEQPSPAAVLARVNDLLCADIPAGMFVTCFYAVLDPASGHVRFANAGHEAPFRQHAGCASELWASGMPLGLLPGTQYTEEQSTIVAGESLLFYSDGLVEAHNPARELYGFARLKSLLATQPDAALDAPPDPTADGPASDAPTDPLIGALLASLAAFTGAGWEQEDDVTLLAVYRGTMARTADPA